MPDNGTQLSYTFLGVNESENASNGAYTPLILPGPSIGTADEINTAQPLQSAEVSGGSKTQQTTKPATPFSKIKNYQIQKIKKGNLDSIRQQTVNVVRDYMWTISPKTSRNGESTFDRNNLRNVNDEVPYILLKEKYFLVNNIIAQALYTLTASIETAQTAADTAAAYSRTIRGIFDGTNTAADIVSNGLPESISSAEGSSLQGISEAFGNLGEFTGASATADIFSQYNNPDLERVLFPYQKLYIVGPTGFTYKLPFLSNTVLNTINNFGESSSQNISGQISTLVGSVTGIAELLTGTAKILTQAGSARIERTKYYQFPTEGQPIEVTIPLYNTRPATYGDICNNFKLMLLLLYQNLPLRQDKIIVEPPVLYDVTIPGGRREPYCYMSSLIINHRGSTRMMDINMAGVSNTGGSADLKIQDTIKTIIPDMYEIKITLQPMIASTKNMLYTTVQESIVNAEFTNNQFLNDLNTGAIPNPFE